MGTKVIEAISVSTPELRKKSSRKARLKIKTRHNFEEIEVEAEKRFRKQLE